MFQGYLAEQAKEEKNCKAWGSSSATFSLELQSFSTIPVILVFLKSPLKQRQQAQREVIFIYFWSMSGILPRVESLFTEWELWGDANLWSRSCTKNVKLKVMNPSFILTSVPRRSVAFLVPVYASLGEFSDANYSLWFRSWVRTLLGAITFNYLTCWCALFRAKALCIWCLTSLRIKMALVSTSHGTRRLLNLSVFLVGGLVLKKLNIWDVDFIGPLVALFEDARWVPVLLFLNLLLIVTSTTPPKIQSLPSDLRAWWLQSCDSWQGLSPPPPLSQDTVPSLTSCKGRYGLSGSQCCTILNTTREIV